MGTTANQVYTFDISGGGFEETGSVACGSLTNIKDLYVLDNGEVFLSADNGVGYLDADGDFHAINTNDFNASVDNALLDYQGNLWFTSSRLGLLRLAPSAFRDVYSTVGMNPQVVNTIVRWQDCYYIGTDKGLDIVDDACLNRVENKLTEELTNVRIRCMAVDSSDHLWICTYGGGLIEVEPDGTEYLYNHQNGSFGNRARLVTQLSDGTILAAGDTGLSFIRNHEILRTIGYQDGLINSMILTVTEMPDGRILAGTDGDGIAVLKDGEVADMLTREDGLSSGVILRTVKDPKSEGVFLVTSNSLCYLEPEGSIRVLDKFPYFNNYDIWVKDEDTLFVMSSAGIYVVERDELVAGGDMAWELLDARRGLGTSLTANSWNWYNQGSGELFLPCDTGVYVIDVDKYDSDVRSYRMQLASVRL
ncbi:MAG: HD domain protein, partial [Firmicutes bacterium]|nr:HD domain protein [Bacillota bacterium]